MNTLLEYFLPNTNSSIPTWPQDRYESDRTTSKDFPSTSNTDLITAEPLAMFASSFAAGNSLQDSSRYNRETGWGGGGGGGWCSGAGGGHLILLGPSLRSRRFRGVGEQRKSEERDFRRFAGAKNGASPPLSFFCLSPHFLRGKNTKIPFLGHSWLPNPRETLATQANKPRKM